MEVHVREVPTSRSVYLVRSFEGFGSIRDYRFYIGNKVRPTVLYSKPCPANSEFTAQFSKGWCMHLRRLILTQLIV